MEVEAKHQEKLVTVTLVTDRDGELEDEQKQVEKGKTLVATLKQELGVAAQLALWVVRANGKLKPLGDHEEHQVKQGDRYEVILRGGVS
jgi:sulfur carrier protein ThiS